MGRPKRKLSAEEREERRRRDRERLERATRELLSSEGWRGWLRTRAVLRCSYSFHNTLLIASQARQMGFELTHVAGFRAWLRLNRCVRKGQQALRILAPVSVKERDADGEETGERRTFFRTAFVFDVSQTAVLPDREPVPLEPPRQAITGDSHAALLEPLERLAGELGYAVRYRPLAGPDGLCDYRQRRISIEADLAANAKVATLVHELGHALIDRELEGDARLGRQLEELVVEAVAYVVCAGTGLATGQDSVPYIAGWEGDNALEQLQRSAELIDRLARRIEQTIAPGGDPEREAALPDAA
jgi:antirestriction protein ArdC